jgi:hypothetical protein
MRSMEFLAKNGKEAFLQKFKWRMA